MPTIRKYAIRTASGWASMAPAEQAEYYGTYTTLSAWWAATQSLNLPGLDIINQAVCFNDWPTGLVDSVSVSGGTSDATRYPMITVAVGHRHNGIPGGNGFYMSAAGDTATKRVQLLTPYAICEYVEALDVYDSAGLEASAEGAILRRCLARGGATRYAIICNPAPGASAAVDSCLAYDTPSRGLHYNGFRTSAITNNVVANCGLGIVNSGGASAILKNNVVFGCTTNYSGADAASSNNASDTGTPPGANPITGITSAAFANVAANDYHLSGTSSVLYHEGVPVAGVEYDIDGDPYDASTPSVGFDEIVAGGGGPIDLSGIAASDSSATAQLSISLPLTAAALSTSSATASLSTSMPVAGDASAQAGANGDMVLSVPIAGAALAQALAQADMGSVMDMAGAAAGDAGANADLSTGSSELSGAAAGSAGGSGAITLSIQMGASALVQALASADLSTGGSDLSGAAAGAAGASAVMWMSMPVAGAASAVASGAGEMAVEIPIQGAAAAAGVAAGGLSISITMDAAAAALASAAGNVVITMAIDGGALIQAAATGALTVGGSYVRPPAARLTKVWPETRHYQVLLEARRSVA